MPPEQHHNRAPSPMHTHTCAAKHTQACALFFCRKEEGHLPPRTPHLQTKVTIVGKKRNLPLDNFWYTNVWVPDPPLHLFKRSRESTPCSNCSNTSLMLGRIWRRGLAARAPVLLRVLQTPRPEPEPRASTVEGPTRSTSVDGGSGALSVGRRATPPTSAMQILKVLLCVHRHSPSDWCLGCRKCGGEAGRASADEEGLIARE